MSKLPIAGGEANKGIEDVGLEGGWERDPLELDWVESVGIMGAMGGIMGVVAVGNMTL